MTVASKRSQFFLLLLLLGLCNYSCQQTLTYNSVSIVQNIAMSSCLVPTIETYQLNMPVNSTFSTTLHFYIDFPVALQSTAAVSNFAVSNAIASDASLITLSNARLISSPFIGIAVDMTTLQAKIFHNGIPFATGTAEGTISINVKKSDTILQ